MNRKQRLRFKMHTKAVVAILLIAAWSLSGFTGFLLWLAPDGQGAGRLPLLFDLTKSAWGDIHF